MKRSSEGPLWLAEGKLPSFPVLRKNLRTEVAIVGAGISGMTAAYLLAQEGKKVVVLDGYGLGGGVTSYTSAHLTTVLDQRTYELKKLHGLKGARLAYESHRHAIDEIEQIVQKEEIDCDFLRIPGELHFDPSLRKHLEREYQMAQELGIPVKQTKDSLIFPEQAQFHPVQYLAGLHEVLKKQGVDFYTARAKDFSERKGVTIRTSNNKKVWARSCLVATHVPVNNRFLLHTKLRAYQSYVLAARIPKNSFSPRLWWDTLDPYHYVRVQAGKTHDFLIVGGEDHRTGQEENPDACFHNLQKWALKHYPFINKFEYQWSSQVMESIDGLAFIGLNPGNKKIHVATGFSGNGLTYGTLAGIIFKDWVIGKENPWAHLYRPSRKNLWGLGAFLKENFNNACLYLDRIPGKGTSSSKEPEQGEGTVVQKGLKKVAIYTDADGQSHQFSALCPHLGCVVHWNKSVKTWDCPCHGSRFTAMGKVIHGPAKTNLKKLRKGRK